VSRALQSSVGLRIQSRGFSLTTAIFLLVVLAVLGAAIVIVSTTQQIGSVLDAQGARVYQAARAGIEWGVYKQKRSGSCAASTSFTFPAAATTLTGIGVTVTCTAYADGSGGPTVYQIQSTACNQAACPGTPSSNYIERRLKVTL
jgi:MSHA biogenesis protein MshP